MKKNKKINNKNNNGEILLNTLYFRINFNGEIEEINVVNNDPEELIEVDLMEYRKMLEQCVIDNQELEKRIDRHNELINYYSKNNQMERYLDIKISLMQRLQKNFDFYYTLVTKFKGIDGARKIMDQDIKFVSVEYIDRLLKEVA